MKWKPSLLPFIAVIALSVLPIGCGSSATTKPITPEEAKAIVGEDPDYLPGDTKAAKKP